MKKLSLEMLKLTSKEVLERSQMQKVLGGQFYNCRCGRGNWFTLMTDNPDPTAETFCGEAVADCIAV